MKNKVFNNSLLELIYCYNTKFPSDMSRRNLLQLRVLSAVRRVQERPRIRLLQLNHLRDLLPERSDVDRIGNKLEIGSRRYRRRSLWSSVWISGRNRSSLPHRRDGIRKQLLSGSVARGWRISSSRASMERTGLLLSGRI